MLWPGHGLYSLRARRRFERRRIGSSQGVEPEVAGGVDVGAAAGALAALSLAVEGAFVSAGAALESEEPSEERALLLDA